MNINDSYFTTLSKASLLHNSTQIFKTKEPHATVFLSRNHHLTLLTIPMRSLTVAQLMQQALEEFKIREGLVRYSDGDQWVMFACKKSGRKFNDLPSLDPSQLIQLTGFKYFLLCPENSSPRKVHSAGGIMTEFTVQKKNEIKPKEVKSCLCFTL